MRVTSFNGGKWFGFRIRTSTIDGRGGEFSVDIFDEHVAADSKDDDVAVETWSLKTCNLKGLSSI